MEIPRHWRLKKQRYGLIGEVCLHCDEKIFPPRGVCPACGGKGKPEEKSANEEADVPADALAMRVLLLENA